MASQILKPSGRYLGKQILIFTLIAAAILLFGAIVGGLMAMDGKAGGAFFVLFLLLAGLFWIIAVLLIGPYYKSLRYEILEDEVIVHVGIWTKSVKHVPFRTVTNIKINRGIFDRFLFNIGTLNIQTAGMSGSTGVEESLVGLEDVHQVYENVAAHLRKFRGGMSPTGADMDAEPAAEGAMAAMLAELKAIRRSLEK